MTKKEMFQALHPDPTKQGARVTKATYEAYKQALLKAMPQTEDGLELALLYEAARPYVSEDILENTSLGWWIMTVKLDLEARGVIERIPGKGRQRVRLLESEKTLKTDSE